jgi:hypothetical protein
MLFSPQLRVRIAAGIGVGAVFGSSLEYNTKYYKKSINRKKLVFGKM